MNDNLPPDFYALTDQIDKELDADRRFFKNDPSRKYLLRQAFPAEVKQFKIFDEKVLRKKICKKDKLYIVVCNLKDGVVRTRCGFYSPVDIETDRVDDDLAGYIFDWLMKREAPE